MHTFALPSHTQKDFQFVFRLSELGVPHSHGKSPKSRIEISRYPTSLGFRVSWRALWLVSLANVGCKPREMTHVNQAQLVGASWLHQKFPLKRFQAPS